MTGFDAATAVTDGVVVRLRHSVTVTNFTVTVILAAVSWLLH